MHNYTHSHQKTLGAFGWVWSNPGEMRVVTDSAGNVTISKKESAIGCKKKTALLLSSALMVSWTMLRMRMVIGLQQGTRITY